jgi:hypothetical protein
MGEPPNPFPPKLGGNRGWIGIIGYPEQHARRVPPFDSSLPLLVALWNSAEG